MTKPQKIFFLSLLLVAVVLIFFRLGRQDMMGDDGHYAFRSVGNFDYMVSKEQTTPVQWFGTRPTWSRLSFHDHPPMFFLLQQFFLKLFGNTVTASRLPSAFAAFGSAVVLFFLGKRLAGIRVGFLALSLLLLNSYFIWTGRIGLLESMFTFFLLLGTLYLVKGFKEDSLSFVKAGLFFGFAMLTKYTFLFAVPAILIFLIWKQRQVFYQKKFWLGILVFLFTILPVFIYNFMMLKTRGHFDVQFSLLFNQAPVDWPKLGGQFTHSSSNVISVFKTLTTGFSFPYFLLFISSLVGSIYLVWRKKIEVLALPMLIAISYLVFFFFIGGASRWLGVLSPWSALLVAFVISEFAKTNFFHKFRFAFMTLGALFVFFSLFYTVNTNHLRKAVGNKHFYSDFRVENIGYNQLDKKISFLLTGTQESADIQESVRQWWFKRLDQTEMGLPLIRQESRTVRSIIIYDSNTEWFPTVWIFDRWKLYNGFFIATTDEMFKFVSDSDGIAALNSLNLERIYLIQSSESVAEQSRMKNPYTQVFVKRALDQNIHPEIIRDDQGREAFYLYSMNRI